MASNLKGAGALAVLISILQIISTSSGASVDQNGGYTLTLGIKNEESLPANIDTYINNIKAAVSSLSIQMWIATHESFFIRNLEIVTPPSWNLSLTTTKDSYKTADIRISSSVESPTVENPNLCGLPGDFIELPQDIFNTAQSGTWGVHWKVLLVQWARYRWGVHEEFGIPGDPRFPYFTKNVSAKDPEPKWSLNGCTNAKDNKLAGTYRTLNGSACDPSSESELDLECRFYPDKNGNYDVTSSLMHFHFMESVTQFCDAGTHQKHSPTKQNLYCDNKSVMEVIESSPDFKVIKDKVTTVPVLKTQVFTAAVKPALYVLLDSGIVDNADGTLINKATLELGKFFANIDLNLQDILVNVAQFPSKDNEPILQELVPLDFLSQNRGNVIEAIGNRNIVNIPHQDFGPALRQTVSAIRAKSPSEGGSILFLKTTGVTNSVTFPVEKEIEVALRADKIKLYTIEITDVNKTRQNLARISGATKGDAIAISRADDVGDQIPLVISTWLNSIVLAEYVDLAHAGNVERIVLSQQVEPGQNYKIPVLAKTETLTFILTTPGILVGENVEAGIITPEVTIRANFKEDSEYGKNRFVYQGVLDTSSWIVNEVTFKYPGSQKGHLTVLSDGHHLPADVSVRVHTSAVDNTLDYGNIQNSDAPFIIAAEVLQGNRPVIGATVIATIQHNDKTIPVPLLDTNPGLGIVPGGGVYSEIVLLPDNGQYTISVTVTKDPSVSSSAMGITTSNFIPPDQNFVTIQPVVFPSGLTKVTSLESNILVTNAEEFVPTVQKIRDLSVSTSENKPTELTFTFSTPRIFNLQNSNSTPMIYTFYSSQDQELLTHLDLKNIPAGVDVAFTGTGGDGPGSLKTIRVTAPRASYTYYVVVGWSSVQYSSLASNIVGAAEAQEPPPGTSTTPTTSSSPGSSQSTGPGVSTADPGISESTKDTSEGTGSTADASSPASSTTGSTPPTSKPEGAGTPWVRTTVGIIVIVATILAFVVGIGAVYWTNRKREARNQTIVSNP